jgi:hypothetical protein
LADKTVGAAMACNDWLMLINCKNRNTQMHDDDVDEGLNLLSSILVDFWCLGYRYLNWF